MPIFPKPFKVPVSHLVCTFSRAFAFHVCNRVPRFIPRVGPEVFILDHVDVKYLVKVYFNSFEVLALNLVGTFPRVLVRPQRGPEVNI